MPRPRSPRFVADDSGATAAEYGIMLALIIGGAIAAVSLLGDSSTGIWARSAEKINAAAGS